MKKDVNVHSHSIHDFGHGDYQLQWMKEQPLKGTRLRHHVPFSKNTDLAGAEAFSKKWGVPMPVVKPAALAAEAPTKAPRKSRKVVAPAA